MPGCVEMKVEMMGSVVFYQPEAALLLSDFIPALLKSN